MRCLLSVVVLVLVSHLVNASGKNSTHVDGKENRWGFYIDDRRYEVIHSEVSWVDAKNICKSIGMKLLSLETLEEHVAVTYEIGNDIDTSFWTSGTNVGSADRLDRFYWAETGEAIARFTNWYPGEPNGYGYLCLQLYGGSGAQHRWDDTFCYLQNAFICEADRC